MKKIFVLLTILMVAMASWADNALSTWTDENGVVYTNVSSANEFNYVLKEATSDDGVCTANIRLTGYIDLTSLNDLYDADAILNINIFKGKIIGQKENCKEDFLRNYGFINANKALFKVVRDAEISHVIFSDCSFKGLDEESGQLANWILDSTIDDVIFSNVTARGDENGYDCDRMGCVAGKANNCHFRNLLFIDCKIITDGSYVGSVVGCANDCDFTNCIVGAGCTFWADGNITSDNSAYVGGLCGYADNCKINTCVNFGTISSDDDRVGGIIGYGTNGTSIVDCKNGGVVKNCTEDGIGRGVRQEVANDFLIAAGIATTGAILSYILVSEGASIICSKAIANHIATGATTTLGTVGAIIVTAGYFTGLGLDLSALTLPEFPIWASTIVAAIPEIFVAVAIVAFGVAASLTIYNWFAEPDEMGGIAGTLEGNCTVLRCTNQGPVECQDNYVGGIVGYLDGATIESCYNRSIVKGSDSSVGGIVGYCKDGIIKNNLNVGMATNKGKYTGCIEGKIVGSWTSSNNYYLADKNKDNGASMAFTQENLPSGKVAKMLNDGLETKLWRQELGKDFYPVIDDTSKPIVTTTTTDYSLEQTIHDGSEFYLAAVNPNAKLSLANDINLSSYYFNLSTETYPFKGELKGNGHKLYNLSYQTSEYVNDGYNFALFPYAQDATFDNFVIDRFNITQKDENMGAINNVSFLTANSSGSIFSNITVRNSNIYVNEDHDYLKTVGALAANSENDTFTSCTIESTCTLQGYSGISCEPTNLGGISGSASCSTFRYCQNNGSLWADDNYDGGIVGTASECIIDRCFNTGGITAQCYVGGIAGYGYNTVITRCVNFGWIADDDNKRERCRAGIVGCLDGEDASISYCMNYGSINYAGSYCGALEGCVKNGATGAYNTHSYYYCQYNGKHADNENEYPEANSIYRYAKIKSGEFAVKATDVYGKTWLYQSIDNDLNYPTKLPVPVPAAGTVHSNILCDGTQSYSNSYQSTGSHTGRADQYGTCYTCGKVLDGVASTINIADAKDLMSFAKYVNRGFDFRNSTVKINNDIDMSGYRFTPIGNVTYPFQGTVNGNGHRIKNLNIEGEDKAGTGLFGYVGGCEINSLILDNSCTVKQTYNQLGTAGFVGCVKTVNDGQFRDVNIFNCGNEANVSSNGGTTGGIIGDVLLKSGNDNVNANVAVTIGNCYNTGNIKGAFDSGSIVGFAQKTGIENTWNVGSITGYRDGYKFAGSWSNIGIFSDCFDINTAQNEVTQMTNDDLRLGVLWKNLREKTAGSLYTNWTQDLGTDSYPHYGYDGIRYSREMSNSWGTIVLPFDVTISDSNPYKFYKLSSVDGSTLNLKKMIGTLAAGTPALVCMDESAKNDETDKYELSLGAANNYISTVIYDSEPVDGLTLMGTYNTLTDLTGIYYIYDNAFWHADDPISILPFRAYLNGSLSSEAKFLSLFCDEDETTGLGDVERGNWENGAIYNLAGQRIAALRKGINIINGKKVLVK